MREYSSVILLHEVVQFSQKQLLKWLSFPHCVFMPPLLSINCPYKCGSFLGSLFCPMDLCVCFCVSTILFKLCSIVWNQGIRYLQLCSSFSRLFEAFRVLCVSIKISSLISSFLTWIFFALCSVFTLLSLLFLKHFKHIPLS